MLYVRFMFGLAGIPSLIQLIGFFFMPESPRWLIGKGKKEKAEKILQKIRGISDVSMEIDEIKRTCEEDARSVEVLGKLNWCMMQNLKKIVVVKF